MKRPYKCIERKQQLQYMAYMSVLTPKLITQRQMKYFVYMLYLENYMFFPKCRTISLTVCSRYINDTLESYTGLLSDHFTVHIYSA